MGGTKKSILNVGRRRSFLAIRHGLLQDAGFSVVSADSLGSAEKLARKKFHALVVGAWMTSSERNRLVEIVKERNPSASVVFYYEGKIEGTEAADAILNARGDHEDLVHTLRHLLSKANGRGGGGGLKALKGIAMILISLGSAVLGAADPTLQAFLLLER